MKKTPNIYDIDGTILRAAGDNEPMSVEKAREFVEQYQKKLKNLDEKSPKRSIYTTYITNLQRYILNYYISHPELLKNNTKTTEEQIKKAMEELKADVDNEYTEFEEVNGGESA